MEKYSNNVVQNAIERNELKDCMMGVGEYEYSDKNDPGPFNLGYILDDFYSLYEQTPKIKANKIFEDILSQMLEGDIKEVFASIRYIYIQKSYEKKGLAKFTLDNSVLQKVNQVVYNRKAELESTEGIEDFYVERNVMDALRRQNRLCKEELGFSLFKE